jgi:hypothetical protein
MDLRPTGACFKGVAFVLNVWGCTAVTTEAIEHPVSTVDRPGAWKRRIKTDAFIGHDRIPPVREFT